MNLVVEALGRLFTKAFYVDLIGILTVTTRYKVANGVIASNIVGESAIIARRGRSFSRYIL